MRYINNEDSTGMDAAHYAALLTLVAIAALVGIRYWFEK